MHDINTIGKVVTISLDVVSRETGRKVKTDLAQLKIHPSKEGVVYMLAACEEGMFEARFSGSKLKKSKVKLDLANEDWDAITACVFDAGIMEEKPPPSGFENVVLTGRLLSLEEYDPETLELVGEELSNTPPDLSISIRTKGMLSVEYGSISLQHKDMEDLSEAERSKMNLLTWILDMAKQIEYIQLELFKQGRSLEESKAVISQKEQWLEEMNSDYKTILHDVEDRFFQVLQSKKRKIAELEGHCQETFELLNENYKEKQKSNLKILHLEDILVGQEDRKYGERKIKRRARKTRKKPENIVKKEPQQHLQIKDEERENLFTGDSNMDVENTPDSNTQDMDADTHTRLNSPEIVSGQDFTDYSDSGDGEGHVQEADVNRNIEDDENETEYSD